MIEQKETPPQSQSLTPEIEPEDQPMQETQNVFEHDSAHESGEEEDQEFDDSSSQNSQEQVKNTMIRESLHYTKLHSVRNREDTHNRNQL